MKWSYGVTTVPSRFSDLLPRTLKSLAASGFDRPRLFVDGAQSLDCDYGLEVTFRQPTIRAYGNWMLGLAELYIREPNADRYAMFQDDLVCSLGLKKFLEKWYPDRGYLNLYTFPVNRKGAVGWHLAGMLSSGPAGFQTGRGAVGLVFSNEAVRILITHQHTVDHAAGVKHGHRKIDGSVVSAMNKAGWKEWVHTPSPLQHVLGPSAIGNMPHKQADSFRGEGFDLTEIC